MIERALLTRARALEGKCEADLMLREEGSPFLARGVRPGPPRQRCPSCTLAGAGDLAEVWRCPLWKRGPCCWSPLSEEHPVPPRRRGHLISKRRDVVVGSVLLLRDVVASIVRGVWVVNCTLDRLPVLLVSSAPTVA